MLGLQKKEEEKNSIVIITRKIINSPPKSLQLLIEYIRNRNFVCLHLLGLCVLCVRLHVSVCFYPSKYSDRNIWSVYLQVGLPIIWFSRLWIWRVWGLLLWKWNVTILLLWTLAPFNMIKLMLEHNVIYKKKFFRYNNKHQFSSIIKKNNREPKNL